MITFRLINEITGKEYKFPLKFDTDEDFYTWIEENCEEYDTFLDEIETKYGVQDFSGNPGIVGYSSYEIVTKDYQQVVRLWVDFWMKHKLYGGKIK